MNTIRKILPHLCIILSGMMITFYIVDIFNNAVAMIDNVITKGLLFVMSLLVIFLAGIFIYDERRKNDE
jgi:hypothetical protein